MKRWIARLIYCVTPKLAEAWNQRAIAKLVYAITKKSVRSCQKALNSTFIITMPRWAWVMNQIVTV